VLNPQEKAKILNEEWRNKPSAPAPFFQPSSAQVKTKIVEEKEVLPKEFKQSITLKAVDLPLSVILKPIGEAVKHHVILGPGVEDKKMSIDVADTPVEHTLNTLLYSAGYGFRAQNHDLTILAQETRIFRIVLPPVTQQFNDVTSNESFVQPADGDVASGSGTNQQVKLGTKVVVENASQGISFWGDVADNIKTLLSPTGQFSINKPAGAVIITDTPAFLERISQYFDDLNRRVTQQIEVDVKVVEVNLNDENRFGVDWNILAEDLKTLNSIGMGTNFASGNFTSGQFFTFNAEGSKPGSGVSASGIKVAIDALSKQGKVEVVSQPKVMILNNQVAVIQVGTTQSFIDHTSLETTQTGTITSISTSQVQEGVTMRLLGNIVGDQIYLSVTPVVTTIDNIRSITSGTTTIEAPQTTTKSINTLVKLNEGETVAIGGLITSFKEKSNQSVPVLSKIPFLGKLFQYVQDKDNKTELVIFITPKRS
jgi:MSHA type pilus biogenesis protein MshL